MGCGITDPAGCIGVVIGSMVGGAVGDVASSAWDQVCKSFADAASQLLGAFGKAFVAIPNVDLASAGIRNVYGISLGLAATVAALLLLGQVISTAFSHDGSALAQALTGVGKAALATLLTLSVAGAGLAAADQLTNFIVTQTFGSVQVLSAKIAAIVSWTGSGATLQAALLLIFAVVGILLTIVLWFEMLLRNAAIAVLVATSPIAAAGQASQATKSWWPKLASATTQLIILKPIIALVFCVGFSLTARSSDVETLLTGMLVLLLAVIAWPVVARFFTFASVQVGGSAGLGAVLGFAAGRLTADGGGPGGIEPDEFSRRAESRTMAGLDGAATRPGSGAGAAPAAGGASAAGAGGAGLIAAGISMAQRAANSLSGRMEQMAGHAGIQGANPYAQPAGYAQRPRRPGGHLPPMAETDTPAAITDGQQSSPPAEPAAPAPEPAAPPTQEWAGPSSIPPSASAPPPAANPRPADPPEMHHDSGGDPPGGGTNPTSGGPA
jgi:hypothetical protein